MLTAEQLSEKTKAELNAIAKEFDIESPLKLKKDESDPAHSRDRRRSARASRSPAACSTSCRKATASFAATATSSATKTSTSASRRSAASNFGAATWSKVKCAVPKRARSISA